MIFFPFDVRSHLLHQLILPKFFSSNSIRAYECLYSTLVLFCLIHFRHVLCPNCGMIYTSKQLMVLMKVKMLHISLGILKRYHFDFLHRALDH